MKNNAKYYVRLILLGFDVIPFAVSLIVAIPFVSGMGGVDTAYLPWIFIVVYAAAAYLAVLCSVADMPGSFAGRYAPVCLPLILTLVTCAVCMAISKGFTGHDVFGVLFIVEIAFLPMTFMMALFNNVEYVFVIPFIYQSAFILFFSLKERRSEIKPAPSKRYLAGSVSLALVCCLTIGWVQFTRGRTVLPVDYGFKYGGGFASVDIYRYDVNNNANILPALDSPSSFRIGDRNKMPVLDGAEAAYPVYSAFANACYEGIADNPRYSAPINGVSADADAAETATETAPAASAEAAPANPAAAVDAETATDAAPAAAAPAAIVDDVKINEKFDVQTPSIADEKITFTNTIYAFERLVNGDVDIFFGAQPSKAQEALAEKAGKKLTLTPVGKDAFVFFVSNTNDCDGLTTQNIRDIYSGKVKNWAPITGGHEHIYAFQRPENSGSQTIMQSLMGDVPLAEPLREEYIEGMGGVYESIADYRNYPGAIGYSFKFFTTAMATDNADIIKLLSIDGVSPAYENIQNSTYPYTVSLYAITLEDNKLDTIAPFLAWMQSAEGQELIRKIGYAPIG